jgi:hypothetical protein
MRIHKLEEYILEKPRLFFDDEIRQGGVLAALRVAHKFYFGEYTRLPDVRLHSLDIPRLPFKICSFELLYQNPEGGWQPIILLAEEGRDKSGREVTLILLFLSTDDRMWCSGGIGIFPRGETQMIWRLPRPLEAELNARADGREGAEILEGYAHLAIQDLCRGLSVLNCVNVRTETVEAPAALNKKRQRNGKPPIYSYKTLVLRPSAAQREDQGGTHESPRIHLRRGHIKHRKTGDFWWQPHVVGDRTRGVVMKDYRADKLIAQ